MILIKVLIHYYIPFYLFIFAFFLASFCLRLFIIFCESTFPLFLNYFSLF